MLSVEISITMCEFEVLCPWIVFHKQHMVLQIFIFTNVVWLLSFQHVTTGTFIH